MGLQLIVGSNPTLSAQHGPDLGPALFLSGGVAEWSNALVLKTSVPSGTGGSNPSPSAMHQGSLFLGLDLGTSGLRGIVATATGLVVAEGRHAWPQATVEPDCWWAALTAVTKAVLRKIGSGRARLRGLSVVSTSGTLVCSDDRGRALAPALMYNDARAREEATALEATGHGMPYKFSASFSLPKALWIQHHRPKLFAQTTRLCHPADWLSSRFTGTFTSDYSNALKMGYDLEHEAWPTWIDAAVRDRLPPVIAPGTVMGRVSRAASMETHVPEGLPVVAGATDGVAGAIASGMRRIGDYNTALGTTLIFKGLSPMVVQGQNLYSHKLPGGLWLPGGASNTGAAWIGKWFAGHDPKLLDHKALALIPTPHVSYPLTGQGERFPFADAGVCGFVKPAEGLLARYASCLQGTAFVERLAYDVLDSAAGTGGGDVYATGGGSRSDVWTQCRANVCRRVMHRVAYPEAAMGAAILAANGTEFGELESAMAAMTRIGRTFEPVPHPAYDEAYARFLEALPVKREQNGVQRVAEQVKRNV